MNSENAQAKRKMHALIEYTPSSTGIMKNITEYINDLYNNKLMHLWHVAMACSYLRNIVIYCFKFKLFFPYKFNPKAVGLPSSGDSPL